MGKKLCSSSEQREIWAVSLSFASATIMSLEALHPGASVCFNMTPDQYFGISSLFASVSTFLGAYILTRSIYTRLPATK
jgi:hypothetical protein